MGSRGVPAWLRGTVGVLVIAATLALCLFNVRARERDESCSTTHSWMALPHDTSITVNCPLHSCEFCRRKQEAPPEIRNRATFPRTRQTVGAGAACAAAHSQE